MYCGVALSTGIVSDETKNGSAKKTKLGRRTVGTILLLIALAGIFYSYTTPARIIGEWRVKTENATSNFSEPSPYRLEFFLNGYAEHILQVGNEYDSQGGSYSLSKHSFTLVAEDGSARTIPYQLVDDDHLRLEGSYENLERVPGFRFYICVRMVLSGFVLVCFFLIITPKPRFN